MTTNTTANEILAMIVNLQQDCDTFSESAMVLSILRDQILAKYSAPVAAPAKEVPSFEVALFNFCAALQNMTNEYYAKHYPNSELPSFTLDHGTKYIKVVKGHGNGSGRSVYCFIEKSTGNILKAASWKAPAKHPRGSIFGANPLDGCNPHGVAYLR